MCICLGILASQAVRAVGDCERPPQSFSGFARAAVVLRRSDLDIPLTPFQQIWDPRGRVLGSLLGFHHLRQLLDMAEDELPARFRARVVSCGQIKSIQVNPGSAIIWQGFVTVAKVVIWIVGEQKPLVVLKKTLPNGGRHQGNAVVRRMTHVVLLRR